MRMTLLVHILAGGLGLASGLALAWLGVLASVLLVVLLPAQLAGFLRGAVTSWMWMPMLVFEVAAALWLLVKGVPSR